MESHISHTDSPLTPDPDGYFVNSEKQTLKSKAAKLPPLIHDQFPEEWDLPGQKNFRRKQIAQWVFEKQVGSFDDMLNLPESLRRELKEKYALTPLTLVRQQGSRDTTRKFLFQTRDQDFIECVLIPASLSLYGDRSDRFTLCISSQVGCAFGCKFCASGLDGWKRNLSPGEIISQIIEVEKLTGDSVRNLVFMGMGEPFANYKNLTIALTAINAPWGLNIGARHITVSTSGLVPIIRKYADQPNQFRLAISLHGASDDVRSKIMPVNERYPLEQLIEACRYFNSKKKQKITFEYILIQGINDTRQQARLLVQHASTLNAKINLIPYNTVDGLEWNRPDDATIQQFQDILQKGGIFSTVRLEKGHDIDAACGQLRLKEMKA
ncbi:MAG: 23S rRNA (adenine(2503)-C(2))-methyltransferase RlmN [Verrucomicrobiota bacterium]